ncbi:hypothetical protein [Microbacterium sp. GXF7504]
MVPPRGMSPARVVRRVVRSRLLRAVMAGALLLGIGATATAAAWTDRELTHASIGTGVFRTESDAGDGWRADDTATGAALRFAVDAMWPGDSRFAAIDLRTTTDTTEAGRVVLGEATASGPLATVLEYRMVRVPVGTTCDAAAFGGAADWTAGGPDAYLAAGTVPDPAVAWPLAAGGAEVHRACVDVRIAAGASSALQGTTGAVTWVFRAVSASDAAATPVATATGWVDEERGSGSFSALTVPMPVIAYCEATRLDRHWPYVRVYGSRPSGSDGVTGFTWSVETGSRDVAIAPSAIHGTWVAGAERYFYFDSGDLDAALGAAPTEVFRVGARYADTRWASQPAYVEVYPVASGWDCRVLG